jgi:tRNA(Arg) A34 adenosine deaminase TadA
MSKHHFARDLSFSLPEWVDGFVGAATFPTAEEQMRCAVELARRNVEQGTGGPFGAAVFDLDTGALVSVGVNLVTRENVSILHAEMVALALAQRAVGSFDLASPGGRRRVLAASCEPCAMCLGALPWSGVRRLLCGARDKDARNVGFDEGEKPRNWADALRRRGIEVVRDVLREEAAAVLRLYAASGGAIYNGRG